jgi:glutamate 5-kinase
MPNPCLIALWELFVMREIEIKVGSSSLVENGQINHAAISHVSRQARLIVESGGRVAITTSGFAAAGGGRSEQDYRKGEELLADAWHEHLGTRAGSLQLVSQMTLAEVVVGMRSEQNEGRIPLNNGHWGDSYFANNDRLSVETAQLLGLGRVVLLGDQEFVYEDINDSSTAIKRIDSGELDECRKYIRVASVLGTGGMEAKFDAVQDAVSYGITCHYGHWRTDIDTLLVGQAGTTFVADIQEARITQ